MLANTATSIAPWSGGKAFENTPPPTSSTSASGWEVRVIVSSYLRDCSFMAKMIAAPKQQWSICESSSVSLYLSNYRHIIPRLRRILHFPKGHHPECLTPVYLALLEISTSPSRAHHYCVTMAHPQIHSFTLRRFLSSFEEHESFRLGAPLGQHQPFRHKRLLATLDILVSIIETQPRMLTYFEGDFGNLPFPTSWNILSLMCSSSNRIPIRVTEHE